MFINRSRQELNLKIVYYGPALSGKMTNLQRIYATASSEQCGRLMSLQAEEDRTLLFDYVQVDLGKVDGLLPRFNLYTVPGQAQSIITRKTVLHGADGVVFVADSAPHRERANQDAWQELHELLYALHIEPTRFPIVIQCNKQDVPGALAVTTLARQLDTNGHQLIPAVATRTAGVQETLGTIMRAALGYALSEASEISLVDQLATAG